MNIVESISSQPRIAVADARGQFGNPEKGERLPLEAFTRRLVKTQKTEKTYCTP
jgi:hypothetical protein